VKNEQTTDLPEQTDASVEQTTISKKERDWALAAHIAPLCAYTGIPLGHLIAPFVIWQMKKEEMPFVAQEAKEALNFNISITIYACVAALLIFILIGFLLIPALIVAHIALAAMTGIRAGDGKKSRYPYILRLVS